MKKDYLPLSQKDSGLSETQHIERFWTQKWNDREISADVSTRIEKQDKFRILEPYLDKIGPKAKILDGGCGVGDWALYLSSRGFHVTAIDLSLATIEKLKEKFPQSNFIYGDIRDTKLQGNSFDLYFSWGTFEHAEEGLGAAFKEAYRVLKPGGYLVTSVPYLNQRLLLRDPHQNHSSDDGDKDHGFKSPMRFYQWRLTKPEFQREFEASGFEMLTIEPVHKKHGVFRMVKNDLKTNPRSGLGKFLQKSLMPFIPKNYVSHMILGVGQKTLKKVMS
jgi:SAM-dependent methyltransferase